MSGQTIRNVQQAALHAEEVMSSRPAAAVAGGRARGLAGAAAGLALAAAGGVGAFARPSSDVGKGLVLTAMAAGFLLLVDGLDRALPSRSAHAGTRRPPSGRALTVALLLCALASYVIALVSVSRHVAIGSSYCPPVFAESDYSRVGNDEQASYERYCTRARADRAKVLLGALAGSAGLVGLSFLVVRLSSSERRARARGL